MKRLMMAVVLFASGAAVAAVGNFCEWTGAANDGKWGTPDNWNPAPVSGNNDVLVFDSATDLVTENDFENLSIGGIITCGTGAKTLNGNRVTFSGNCLPALNSGGSLGRSYSISNCCSTTFNLAILCGGDVAVLGDQHPSRQKYDVRFVGAVTMASGKTFRIGDAYAYNRDRSGDCSYVIDGKVGDGVGTLEVSGWNSTITFNGDIDVQIFKTDYANTFYLPNRSRSVRVRSGTFTMFYAKPYFRAKDTFVDDGMILNWSNSYYEQSNCTWFLAGNSQTIDRLGAGFDKDDDVGNGIASSSLATLTMKATAGCSTYGILKEKLSVVWDPQDNFTLEFKKRASSTSGSLDIRRGEFKLSDGATMLNVPSLKLGSGASLTIVNPTGPCFKAGVEFDIAADATLNLPDGYEQTVAELLVGGNPVLAGTYSETADVSAGVKALAQIKGAGRLVVTDQSNYWQGTVDSDWNKADNWVSGVPTEALPGVIRKPGTYAVEVNESPAAFSGDLTMKSASGLASLVIAAPIVFTNSTIEVGPNAKISVAANGRLDYVSPTCAVDAYLDSFRIHDGGELASAGTVNATNLHGRIILENGGKLTLTGGMFFAVPPLGTRNSSAIYADNSFVTIRDTAVFTGSGYQDGTGNQKSGFYSGNGSVTEIGGTANLRLNQWFWGKVFGTGTHTISDTATMWGHGYIRGHFTAENAGETCTVIFKDNAQFSGFQELSVGVGVAGSTSILKVQDNASVSPGSGFQSGCNNGYGEVVVSGGTFSGGATYGIHLGYKSPEDGSSPVSGHCPTGVLTVAGGTVNVKGSGANSHPLGLIVGDGSAVGSTASGVTSRFCGFVNLSAGTITHATGNLVVGCGYGYGRVTQAGGVFNGTVWTPTEIGFAGGEGEWLQSGGEAKLGGDVFVGGVATNFNSTVAGQTAGWKTCPCLRQDSKGLLSVTGGTFTLASGKNLYVSAFGAGTLALGGTGVITANEVVLTNTVDEANGKTYPATVKVTLSADGAGLIRASKLVIAEGTKLIVDVGSYEGRSRAFAEAPVIEGAFQDITYIGANKDYGKVFARNGKLYAGVQRGSIIFVR